MEGDRHLRAQTGPDGLSRRIPAHTGGAISRHEHRAGRGQGQFGADYTSDLRWLEGGMLMDSRYLAMVRRATLMPCSSRISASLLSLMGLVVVSHSTRFLMIERIAVAEQVPPSAVGT